jgi:hypothetical protein
MNTNTPAPPKTHPRILTAIARANLCLMLAFAFLGFLAPGVLVIRNLADRSLREPGVPDLAWRTHRKISPGFARWANERVASGAGARYSRKEDVPATEWPVFACVFYLTATDNLQMEWTKTRRPDDSGAPAVYARKAIDAAAGLITDPVHHTWVREYWGTNFWHQQDLFFRSLVIAGLTRYESLTGDRKHHDLLVSQVTELADELDKSRTGLLEDYPGECYPLDVLAGIAWIRESDRVTGLDHSAFVQRAVRAFDGKLLDERGLVPFFIYLDSLQQEQPARGTGNSWVSTFAPHLWPDRAKAWYDLYEQHFWQRRLLAAGFREFPRTMTDKDWGFDVDSGPIVGGFSPAANAFGVAAARVNGRFDHAWPLSAQMIAASWPTLRGRLAGARFLSLGDHAPYLGEAAILYFLTEQPAPGVAVRTGGSLPGFVYVGIGIYFLLGLLFFLAAMSNWRRWKRNAATGTVPAPRVQSAAWMALMTLAVGAVCLGPVALGMIAFFLAQVLPRSNPAPGQNEVVSARADAK